MSGLLALLDDVAAIAKVAAASIDDVAGQAAKAGVKAAGAVIDDAAVTPKYVHGFPAARELPIVWRIALGSIRNKLLILLPAALLLSAFAPWAITPLLMIGGAYLCFEGAEKVAHMLWPPKHHASERDEEAASAEHLEEEKVAGAIKTDFILSAEIMTIALAAVPAQSLWMQAAALAVVAVGITVLVYGSVALIVKADDIGLAMCRSDTRSWFGDLTRATGRRLVHAMPGFLTGLSTLGTAAMIWVGGAILIHGLEGLGFSALAHLVEQISESAAHALPEVFAGFGAWLAAAFTGGVFGLVLGLMLVPIGTRVIGPLWASATGKNRSVSPH